MREGELLGLQWEDLDWTRNLIDLRRTVAFRKGTLIVNTPKSGELRTIDIPLSLMVRPRELRSIRQAKAAVAGTEARPWVVPSLTGAAKPLTGQKKAKVPRLQAGPKLLGLCLFGTSELVTAHTGALLRPGHQASD